jgi:hypothetical protein
MIGSKTDLGGFMQKQDSFFKVPIVAMAAIFVLSSGALAQGSAALVYSR